MTMSHAMSETAGVDDGRLTELAEVTRAYARYSRSAGGLSLVIGGVLCLAAYFIGALADLGQAMRFLLAGTPLLWIVSKVALTQWLYQRHGRVKEAVSRSDRLWHIGFTAFTAAVSAGIVIFVFTRGGLGLGWEIYGYLAFVIALPVLVWFFMRTWMEFVIGVFLVAQAAVVLAGGNYELGQQPQAPIVAAIAVAWGVKEHLDYRRIRERMQALRGGA
jgi:hypothetical protein